MKGIGVFSDIHGNRQAFAALARVIEERRDLDWICLGDVVGWFFRPVECVLMLKSLVDRGLVNAMVAGNHDLMALGLFADKAAMIDRMLATSFSAGMLAQSPEARDFLRSVERHTLEGDSWVAAHHSPFGRPHGNERPAAEHYGMIEHDLPAQFDPWKACPKPVVLTGHGHVPRVYGVEAVASARLEDVVTSTPDPKDAQTTVPIRPGWRYWVRNGTVGGPYHEGYITCHWTEYRPGDRVTLHRLGYDTRELEEDIRSREHLMTWRDTWQKKFLRLLPAAH
jgi:predicted phosphodiesterase